MREGEELRRKMNDLEIRKRRGIEDNLEKEIDILENASQEGSTKDRHHNNRDVSRASSAYRFVNSDFKEILSRQNEV